MKLSKFNSNSPLQSYSINNKFTLRNSITSQIRKEIFQGSASISEKGIGEIPSRIQHLLFNIAYGSHWINNARMCILNKLGKRNTVDRYSYASWTLLTTLKLSSDWCYRSKHDGLWIGDCTQPSFWIDNSIRQVLSSFYNEDIRVCRAGSQDSRRKIINLLRCFCSKAHRADC